MTQEIIKIVGIEVKMPYHNEVYIVGEKPDGHISGIVRNAGIVEEIRLAEEEEDSIQERDVIYIKMEKKRNNIRIIHKSTRFKNNLE